MKGRVDLRIANAIFHRQTFEMEAPFLDATRSAYGAEIRMLGQSLSEPLVAAAEFAETTGAVFIHPFDHPDVIAGQGTVGLEVLDPPIPRSVRFAAASWGHLLRASCFDRAAFSRFVTAHGSRGWVGSTTSTASGCPLRDSSAVLGAMRWKPRGARARSCNRSPGG